VIKINARKATLSYVDFDGSPTLPAFKHYDRSSLYSLRNLIYSFYDSGVPVRIASSCTRAMKILVVFIVGYEIKVEYSFSSRSDYLS
jgi:hypothetical protein